MLNHANHVHPVNDLAKYNMFVVQKWGCSGSDKKLTTIGVWARVLIRSISLIGSSGCRNDSDGTYCHAKKTRSIMLEREIFVCKFGGAVDSTAPRAIAINEVATLDHKVFNL